jgi:hypothetical protein
MALDRNELSLLIQSYMGHTPRDKGMRSYFNMSEELTDKILKMEEKKGDRDLVDKK